MAYNLKIGGTSLTDPDPKGGITESYEKIWSSDTGRTSKGKMKGTLIATKRKVSLKWSEGLTTYQASEIKDKIASVGFTTISYKDCTGSTVSYNGYFGTPQFTFFDYNNIRYITDLSVDFIEQ